MSAAPLSRLMKLLAVYTFFRFCQARKACFAEKWLKIIRMSVKRKSFGAIFVENRESLRPAVGELEQAAEKLAPREVRYALAREQRERRDRRGRPRRKYRACRAVRPPRRAHQCSRAARRPASGPFARLFSRSRAFSLVRTLCTVFCVPSVTGTAGSGASGVTVTSEYAAKP